MNRHERRVASATGATKTDPFAGGRRVPDSDVLVPLPRERWPSSQRVSTLPLEVWISRRFLVQVYAVPGHPQVERLTVSRLKLAGVKWLAPITWDELQQIKHEAQRGDRWAVEIFPPDDHVVNVAPMRHLWMVPPSMVPWAWGLRDPEGPVEQPAPEGKATSAHYRWHESPGSDGLWHRLHPAMGPGDLLPRPDVIAMWPEGAGWAWELHGKEPAGAGLAGFLRNGSQHEAKLAAVEHARRLGVIEPDATIEEEA